MRTWSRSVVVVLLLLLAAARAFAQPVPSVPGTLTAQVAGNVGTFSVGPVTASQVPGAPTGNQARKTTAIGVHVPCIAIRPAAVVPQER